MAALNFEQVINLTESDKNIAPLLVRNLCMVNEPNNELVQYYIDSADLAEDKAATVAYNNYPDLQWGNKKKRLTSRNVSRIGVKAFPGVGAIAFFKYKYEDRSIIMCPVNNNKTKFTAPVLNMVRNTSNIVFTITPPKDITYQCYRIVLANQYFTIEYVTYELTLIVPLPEVKGKYNIYCVGYVEEGQAISFDSNVYTFTVNTGKDTFEPDPNISYYTKAEIEEIIKTLIPKTYIGDNETIDVNQDTGVITVNSDYRKIIESSSPTGTADYVDTATTALASISFGINKNATVVNTIEILED